MPSFYQGDFFRALVNSKAVDLQVIFARDLSQDRVQLGWEADLRGFPYRMLVPGHTGRDAMKLARQQRRRLHIVNGIWAEPAFAAALTTLIMGRSRFAIYTEAPTPFQPRSAFKRWLRTGFGRLVCSRAAGTFPVSHFATDFLIGLGVAPEKIYPFGYFRSPPIADTSPVALADRQELVFIGQIIQRKGLDLLLAALVPLFKDHPDLHLTFIGVGEQSEQLMSQVSTLELSEQVHFAGMIPAQDIFQRLQSATALVLPSRWDGWGLVVNEALSMGVPVIVSDQCGAADLVRNGYNGYVFRSEDRADLEEKLRRLLANSDMRMLREHALAVGRTVVVESIVPYFIDCLRRMSGEPEPLPVPPWESVLQMDRV